MRVTPKVRRAATAASVAVLSMVVVLTGLIPTPAASAFSREGLPVEYLNVYSAAMGRNVPVQFQGPGGAAAAGTSSKAVYLLDGLRAQDDFNGWDVDTAAFEWFFESGVATVMPVGGKASFYSDWYSPSSFNKQASTYKWETFLSSELPAWLAANKQISATGNGVVGVSMSGGAALTLAAYHPAQFTYAASLSGLLNPSTPAMKQAIRVAMLDAGGYNVDDMWGPPWDAAWKRNDPVLQVSRLVGNGTRLWIFCAPGTAEKVVDPGQAMPPGGLESLAIDGNERFRASYATAGGSNATFQFPAAGNQSWASWGQQLQALKPDLLATLRG